MRNESFLQKKTAPPTAGEALLMVPMVTLFSAKASYLFFLGFLCSFYTAGLSTPADVRSAPGRARARRKPQGPFALKLCGQTVDNQSKPMSRGCARLACGRACPGSFASHAAVRGGKSASADEKTNCDRKGRALA